MKPFNPERNQHFPAVNVVSKIKGMNSIFCELILDRASWESIGSEAITLIDFAIKFHTRSEFQVN